MIYHDISSHINDYYGRWEKQTQPGVKPGWESPNVIEEVSCSESYGGLNGEMSSLQSLHHFSIARSSKYPEAIFSGKYRNPPDFMVKTHGCPVFRFSGENPADTSISCRSWPSESVSVDLACQRALLAAASEIRQNQKLGRGPRGTPGNGRG